MASRTLGVHAKDRPALVSVTAGDAAINVAGMVFLAERGPASIKRITNSPAWEAIFGGYKAGKYGKYEAEGFFLNLSGIDGELLCRRLVPADATVAERTLVNGETAGDSIKISAGYRGEADKGSHGLKVLYTIAHSNRVSDALVAPAAAAQAVLSVTSALSFEIGDHIIVNDGVTTETFAIIAKDEALNTITCSANIAKSGGFGISAFAGSQKWGFSAAKTGASLAGLAAGTYTASISIDGVAKPISITAAGSETLADIVSGIQTDIGAAGTCSFEVSGNGFIKIVSATTGASSAVVITDTDLFGGLDDVNPSAETAIHGADSTTVKTLNFDLEIYRKNTVGVIEKKESWLYLSMSQTVSSYLETVLNNQYSGSGHVTVEDLEDALGVGTDKYQKHLPIVVSTPTALNVGGADGSTPGNTDWNNLLAEFDIFTDLRHLCNPESVTKNVNDYGEAYCKNRGDVIWYTNFQGNQTYEELLLTAENYCVSNDAYRMNNAEWLEVSNPIGVGANPTTYVPNVGFIMGHAIYWLSKYGYQRVPAGIQENIKGALGVYGDQVLKDTERTKLADLGMNVIQFVSGSGIVLRNGRMGSKNPAYKWYNQIFMRLYYKVTFKQSFEPLENVESGEALLSQMFNAVREYMLADYNGSRRTGNKSAFLRYAGSSFENVVTIICDSSNNVLADVLAGMVTIDIYFTPPPPAESIEIGVGISLQIQQAS